MARSIPSPLNFIRASRANGNGAVRRLGIVLLAGSVLGGCASATPGFQPASGKPSLAERIKPFDAGEVADNGIYKPSDAERALDCRRLLGSMRIIISRLRDSQNRPAPSAIAASAQQAARSISGKPGIDMTAEEKREKSRLVAYNGLLKEKQCAQLDIEQELSGGAAVVPPVSVPAKSKK